MFIVLLKFSDNKARASELMPGHMAWLQRGFDEDVFLLSGSPPPGRGGAILAHNTVLPELQSRVDRDPFVAEKVVNAEIIEIAAAKADPRLQFLLG